MTEPAEHGAAAGDAGNRTSAPRPGMPRWVKVFLIVAAALVVLLVALMLIGGGQHGPGRHRAAFGAPVSERASPALTGFVSGPR